MLLVGMLPPREPNPLSLGLGTRAQNPGERVYVYICVYIHKYIYMYIDMYITHIYIHTHVTGHMFLSAKS